MIVERDRSPARLAFAIALCVALATCVAGYALFDALLALAADVP